MRLMTYESIRDFIKGILDFIPGLGLTIRHVETTNPDNPSVRIEFYITRFSKDEDLRKLTNFSKTHMLEVSLETFEDGDKYFKHLYQGVLDTLSRSSQTSEVANSGIVSCEENIKIISEEEYETFIKEYIIKVENFTASSVNTFPQISVSPISDTMSIRTIYLEKEEY